MGLEPTFPEVPGVLPIEPLFYVSPIIGTEKTEELYRLTKELKIFTGLVIPKTYLDIQFVIGVVF